MKAPAIVIIASISAVGVAACGGGSKPSRDAGGKSPLAVSQCMRSHGVPNFPDPTPGPGGGGLSMTLSPGSSTVTVDGITLSGPAFTTAERECNFGPPASGPPQISEASKQGMLKNAECMRTHGVPGFRDPIVTKRGVMTPVGPGLSSDSPAFEAAAKACAHVGVGIPGEG